jgi:hypothetical protein
MAPKPPAPVPPPVSSPPVVEGAYGLGPAPMSPPPSAAPKPSPSQPVPATPPPPPPPPGEYTRSYVCHLCGTWLAFVPPACVLLIFLLSFFTWHVTESTTPASLWGLAWTQQSGLFIAYTILLIISFPFVFAALVFDKGWVVAPPPLVLLMTFKNLIVGALLSIAFLLVCFDYLDGNLLEKSNPIAWPMKVAFRLHFVAILASFLMFWLHWRKKSNLPLPKCEVRW